MRIDIDPSIEGIITNGDVIKALFPNFRIDKMSHSVWVGYDNMSFRREWWDAPYMRQEQILEHTDINAVFGGFDRNKYTVLLPEKELKAARDKLAKSEKEASE